MIVIQAILMLYIGSLIVGAIIGLIISLPTIIKGFIEYKKRKKSIKLIQIKIELVGNILIQRLMNDEILTKKDLFDTMEYIENRAKENKK